MHRLPHLQRLYHVACGYEMLTLVINARLWGPMCGVTITLGSPNGGLSPVGSFKDNVLHS